MTLYEQYRKNRFSLSPFGIEKRSDNTPCFCTPRGAVLLGWTGTDGIHYCTVKTLGDVVFAVDPYADPKKHVFPVAEDFSTFLRLLIACGDEAFLEQAHALTREQYQHLRADNPLCDAQIRAAQSLAEACALTPMEDPYTYLKEIYDSFDFDTVPYTKEYYEIVPIEEPPCTQEWKIYYSSCGHSGKSRERAGTELPLESHLSFAGYDWYIPCAYVCAKGIIVDLLADVPEETIRAFHDKWGHTEDDGTDYNIGIQAFLSEEDRLTLEAENPFSLSFSATLTVDGCELREERGMGDQYVPAGILSEDEYPDPDGSMKDMLAHYHLSTNRCWMFRRLAFPWQTTRKPECQTLRLRLLPHPVTLPGIRFHADGIGQKFSFFHPITNTEHILTVTRYETGTLPVSNIPSMKLPTHYTEIAYTLTPDIPKNRVQLRSTTPAESTRIKNNAAENPEMSAAIGIIGGADGPTACVLSRPHTDSTSEEHTAISTLTWQSQIQSEWFLTFQETRCEAVTAVLLPRKRSAL